MTAAAQVVRFSAANAAPKEAPFYPYSPDYTNSEAAPSEGKSANLSILP